MVLALVLCLVVIAGCAQTVPREGLAPWAELTPGVNLVWPPPPDVARIKYLGRVAGARDLRVEKSFLRRFGELITGVSDDWLVRPTSVAARDDFLAVADPGARALFLFDRAGGRFERVTHAEHEDLVSPVSVALDDANRVYLADSYLRQIYVYDRAGVLQQVWGTDVLERPVALAFDERRRWLYVADTAGHRILAYDANGELVLSFGERGTAAGEFNWPSNLCLDRDGHVYVVDALNFRVQVFDADGRFLSVFGHHGDGSGDFARPKGVAVDSQGHVYVADALFDAVQIFDRDGQFLLAFGQQGVGPGEFSLPVGLAIDRHDHIYVADSYNQRVQRFAFLGAR
jgi:sugar lactone lactonase YvrE